jgi:hypothetical protein
MTYGYQDDADTAAELLEEFGQSVTLTSKTSGAYSVSTGTAAVTTSTQTVSAVVLDYGSRDIDGTLIRAGDKRLLMAPQTTAGVDLTAPVVDDIVAVGGTTYTIKGIKTISPAGTVVLFDCNIRS